MSEIKLFLVHIIMLLQSEIYSLVFVTLYESKRKKLTSFLLFTSFTKTFVNMGLEGLIVKLDRYML